MLLLFVRTQKTAIILNTIFMKTIVFILTLLALWACQKKQDTTPAVIDKNKLLQLVNAIRQQGCTCGAIAMPIVPPLVWNNLLEKAAQDHSQDMNQHTYFSHTSQDGRNPGQRITNVGYIWTTYAENIAEGYANEEAVIQGWKESEGHCKNIMSAKSTEMGVGKSGKYWTQVFGKR